MRIAQQLAKITINEEALNQALLRPISMSVADKDRFIGKYKFNKKNILEIKRDGDQLYSNLNQFKGLKLYPGKDNTLFYRDMDAYFKFEMDNNGKIIKTEYVQMGQSMYPEKVK